MELTLWTYEGPPHVGAIRIAASMRDVHLVLHAPQGDTYADLLFTMIEREGRRPPVTPSPRPWIPITLPSWAKIPFTNIIRSPTLVDDAHTCLGLVGVFATNPPHRVSIEGFISSSFGPTATPFINLTI